MAQRKKRFIWHHSIHEAWGKERLYFFRLSFYPTYDIPNIRKRMKELLYDYGVHSFVIYELTGDYDFLLRVWLPTSVSSKVFRDALHKELEVYDIDANQVFHVAKIVTHWVWDKDGEDRFREPSGKILRVRFADEDIIKINQGMLEPDEAEAYKQENIIAPWMPKKGIKFIIVIPEAKSLAFDAHNALISRIQEILQLAHDVFETSIYEGEGFARILLMGRAKSSKFDDAISYIIRGVNKSGVQAFYGIKTYTYIAYNCSEDLLNFEERLPVAKEVYALEKDVIEELLSETESLRLEVKGSAFVDIGRIIFGDGKSAYSDKITNEGVIKAVVGLLNAQGGKIVIGALELSRFEKDKAHKDLLKSMKKFNDYIICGINNDYINKDWDHFQLRLQDLLEKRIEPSPSVWVTIKRVFFLEKEMCVISVRKPTSDWFYFNFEGKTVFYVRQGNRTLELPGSKADQYKRANER